MNSAAEYLDRTASASRKLFEGIDEYLQVLRDAPVPIFLTSTKPGQDFDREFHTWAEASKERNAAAEAARKEFTADAFALDTLCGALLQIADKALECFSTNTMVPPAVQDFVKPGFAKFCVGPDVRGLPMGLIVYAARNQHTHFNEEKLREPRNTVFERLATTPGHPTIAHLGPFRDPAFDLKNPYIVSYAANVTALLRWRAFEDYDQDMREMLGI